MALAVDRKSLWVGGAGGLASRALGGIQESRQVWQPGIAALPLSAVTALLALEDVVLAGGSEGIAYSFDGGKNWQQAQLEDGLAAIMALAASPTFADDRTALAATLEHGLLRTTDGGRTWVNASFGLESLEVSALVWENATTLLAATDAGIYRSRDAGRAWRRIYADDGDADSIIEALAVLPDGTLVAGLESGRLLLSHDNGAHWQTACADRQSPTLSLYATPAGTLLWGTIEGLLRSDDAGQSWQMVHGQAVYACASYATQLYAGHVQGVSVSSDDGRTWRELSPPPLYDLHIVLRHPDHLWLSSIQSGILPITPLTGWLPLAETIPMALSACQLLDADTFLLASPGGLQRLSLSTGQRTILLEQAAITSLVARQTQGRCDIWVVQADGTGLQHSPDGGEHWQALSTPFGILPLVAFEAVADRLLAATYDPRQYQVCIWYSTDDGRTWVRSLEAATRWPLVATCVQPAAISVGNLLFLEGEDGQWQKISVGHDGGAIRRVLGLRQSDRTTLYVLTTTSIQCSQDRGATWQQMNAGLPVEHILDLALNGSTLTVLLTGGRIWQRNV